MSKTIDEFDIEVDHLRNRLDTLEEQANAKKLPWYKSTATAISVLAFVVSLGSTALSLWHTRQQDVRNMRAELRGIMQRLTALPKENLENTLKYQKDPASQIAISGLVNQENMMLALQADDILRRLPTNDVSAIDYLTVGSSLIASRRFDAARLDLEKAEVVSVGLDDEIGTLRNLGSLQMTMGMPTKCRETFSKGMAIFEKFPGFDEFTQAVTNTQTALIWAAAEASGKYYSEAMQHVADAESIARKIPRGPAADTWIAQVAQFKQTLYAAQQGSVGAASILPSVVANGVNSAGGLAGRITDFVKGPTAPARAAAPAPH